MAYEPGSDPSMIDAMRYVPFADPAFAPDWVAEDRPDWPLDPREDGIEKFESFCRRQLSELDKRASLPSVAISEERKDYLFHRMRFLEEIGMQIDEYERIKLRISAKRETVLKSIGQAPAKISVGPTVNAPRSDEKHPSSLASEDIAKLRYVIFPRFWSASEICARTFNVHEVAKLAASRHFECTGKSVFRCLVPASGGSGRQ